MKMISFSDLISAKNRIIACGFKLIKDSQESIILSDKENNLVFIETDQPYPDDYTIWVQPNLHKKFALWLIAKSMDVDVSDNSLDQVDYFLNNLDFVFDQSKYSNKYEILNAIPICLLSN